MLGVPQDDTQPDPQHPLLGNARKAETSSAQRIGGVKGQVTSVEKSGFGRVE